MSTPNKYAPQNNVPSAEETVAGGPCCPHCGKELQGLATFVWEIAAAVRIVAVFCPEKECRKVLHMTAAGAFPQPQAPGVTLPV